MLGRMRQDDFDFQASLDYIGDPIPKNKLTKKKREGEYYGYCMLNTII
jgi:hypothetical protein